MLSHNRKTSICFLITALHPVGGAEMQVTNLAAALHKRGWPVSVVTLVDGDSSLTQHLRKMGINLVSLGMRRGWPDPLGLLRFVRLIESKSPQIVHSHMVHATLLARVSRIIAPVAVTIATVHTLFSDGHLRMFAYRITDSLCDLTTLVSFSAANYYLKKHSIKDMKACVVPNGVDTERFCPEPRTGDVLRQELGLGSAFVWLALGRLAAPKNYPCMLRAFANATSSDAVLLIAGEGKLRREYEILASKLGIGDRVRFLGFCSEPSCLLKAADAFVTSSTSEAMPMVLLEASATGLPIVATDVGGNAEVVKDGRTGFLVPPEDPAALSQAMQQMMSLSADQRRALGCNAREHIVCNYGLDQIVNRWEQLYHTLVTQNGNLPRHCAKRVPPEAPGHQRKRSSEAPPHGV
jgi:glycosyltransferase involved in cell wall biosynthesis